MEQVQTVKKMVQVTKGLQFLLLINALSTGFFGLVLLLFGGTVGNITGIEHPLTIRIAGFGLLIFISFVYWASKQKDIPANMLLVFAIIDLLWVIDSFLLVFYLPLTTFGIIIVILVAILVAVFSFYEFYFYRVNQK
jgi:hypothetical protein